MITARVVVARLAHLPRFFGGVAALLLLLSVTERINRH